MTDTCTMCFDSMYSAYWCQDGCANKICSTCWKRYGRCGDCYARRWHSETWADALLEILGTPWSQGKCNRYEGAQCPCCQAWDDEPITAHDTGCAFVIAARATGIA